MRYINLHLHLHYIYIHYKFQQLDAIVDSQNIPVHCQVNGTVKAYIYIYIYIRCDAAFVQPPTTTVAAAVAAVN